MADGWTAERVERLKDLYAERRYSSTEIGARMGISRNAVIGKLHRLKLVVTPTTPTARGRMGAAAARKRPRNRKYKIGTKSNAQIAHERAAAQATYEAARSAPDIEIPSDERQTLLIRGLDGKLYENESFDRHSCHWPLDSRSPSGMMEYCGRPALAGASYCPHHMARLAHPLVLARRGFAAFRPEPLAQTEERGEKHAVPARAKEPA